MKRKGNARTNSNKKEEKRKCEWEEGGGRE
jgi:hypothetical protein